MALLLINPLPLLEEAIRMVTMSSSLLQSGIIC